MPFDQVMGKFKQGNLNSGSPNGPQVTDPRQALAIMLSEKMAASKGKKEYVGSGGSNSSKRGKKKSKGIGPSFAP